MLVPGLYQFFRRQIQHGFGERGLAEPDTVDYVSDVLTRFAHTPVLYSVRNHEGAPIENLVGLLTEQYRSQGWDDAKVDRPREALVIKHIAEYALFMSGLFRERLKHRGQLNYYLSHGRSAFWHCAGFEVNPNRARVFRRLYGNFDLISGALDHIRHVQLPLHTSTRESASPLTALWKM